MRLILSNLVIMKGVLNRTQEVENMKKESLKVELISLLLALLFVYTGLSKLIDWYGTKNSLFNQVFPEWMAEAILFGLPPLEISVAVMLLVGKWRTWGLWLSVVLMGLFTAYIGLVLTGIFGRIPCSCGGVLDSLGWWEHLGFNVVVLGMAVWGVKGSRISEK